MSAQEVLGTLFYLQKGAELLKKVHINWWARRKITALTAPEQVSRS